MYRMNVEKFEEKLQETYNFNKAVAGVTVKALLDVIPEEIVQNVVEWYENKELTDIRIEDISIPMILEYWKNDDFLRALIYMIELKKDPDEGKRLIWDMKR